jgi:phosphatidylglycerol:prolipoprotein diacylglycerol transferase
VQPFYHIFGKAIPVYGTLGVVGFAFAMLLAVLRCKKFGIAKDDVFYVGLFAGVGAIVGAKILHIITVFAGIPISAWSFTVFIQVLTNGGGVFYGGLIGAGALGFVYIKAFKLNLADITSLAAPSIGLFHFFGRLGCFFGGCCYGVEVDWGITFEHSMGSPNGVPLMPVQLFEAGFCFLLFLLFTFWQPKKRALTLPLYIMLYSVERFILEFYRGDQIRGFFGVLSTSQWIAILMFICCFVFIVCKGRAKN